MGTEDDSGREAEVEEEEEDAEEEDDEDEDPDSEECSSSSCFRLLPVFSLLDATSLIFVSCCTAADCEGACCA